MNKYVGPFLQHLAAIECCQFGVISSLFLARELVIDDLVAVAKSQATRLKELFFVPSSASLVFIPGLEERP